MKHCMLLYCIKDKVILWPESLLCTAAVAISNQAVKLSLCRHKNEGGHGQKGTRHRLTLKS